MSAAAREGEGSPVRLHGLPPIVSPATRLLVLGSFPGARSLAMQQYYAHPQNHFWRILGALWSEDLPGMPYSQRADALRAHGLGLWDVYASCEREGSLDTAIRGAEVNDFSSLLGHCPELRAVAHNGGESFGRARAVAAAFGPAGASVAFHRLPSTSPANASWSFERKRAAWAEVFRIHGLI